MLCYVEHHIMDGSTTNLAQASRPWPRGFPMGILITQIYLPYLALLIPPPNQVQ